MPIDDADVKATIEELVAKYALETGGHLDDPELLKLAKARLSDQRDRVLHKEMPPLSATRAAVCILREGRYAAAESKSSKAKKASAKRQPVDLNALFSAEEQASRPDMLSPNEFLAAIAESKPVKESE